MSIVLTFIIIATLVLAACLFLILIIPVSPLPDKTIIENMAAYFQVSKQNILNTQVVTQLLGSTLAQQRDVPAGVYTSIIDVPDLYFTANIYTVSQITDLSKVIQTPVVLNEPFEIFLAAVNMAQTRDLPFFYLFSLYSFGEEKFLAFSNQPLSEGYSEVSMYPWTPLQYAELLANIGPAVKRGYYNPLNFF